MLGSGCDQTSEPADNAGQDDAIKKVETVDAEPTKALSNPAQASSETAPEMAVTSKTSDAEKKPKKPLNLALPDSEISSADGQIDAEEQRVLPNMFGGSEQGTKVGGGIIRDAENLDYVDSIQGAEVSVEFKTD